MIHDALLIFAGLLLAAIASIKWPEKWAGFVAFARSVLWTMDQVRIFVDRDKKIGVLLVCALASSFVMMAGMAQQVPGPGALAQVDSWYEWILAWLLKPAAGPLLASLVWSWIITQRYKMNLPADMAHDQRRRKTQRFSFYAAFLPCAVLWPIGWMFEGMSSRNIYLVFVGGILVSALAGAASPFLYTVVMSQIYKRGWLTPEMVSGEARADAKRAEAAFAPAAPTDTQ